MLLQERLNAFVQLGNYLRAFTAGGKRDGDDTDTLLSQAIQEAGMVNPWFTEKNVMMALSAIGRQLEEQNLRQWIGMYPLPDHTEHKNATVGVVTAGNIPLVGFHDFLCVLISGHKFLGKLSSRDDKLLRTIAQILLTIEPRFAERIEFTDEFLRGYRGVIATGNNNSARYFDYYFRNVPHIIRKNRNGIAILNGNENKEALERLAGDVFSYFGLGCRSVSKLYVPEGYDFSAFFEASQGWSEVIYHHHYANNYEYNKTIFLVNKIPHIDNGFLLVKEDTSLASPVAVLYYEYYRDPALLNKKLQEMEEQIQCIVSDTWDKLPSVPFGKAQDPELWDYADGIDTLQFLLQLKGA